MPVTLRKKKVYAGMNASSQTARLRPNTERWLQELTKDLPPDLIDPRELEDPPKDLPKDPFRKRVQSISQPQYDLDNTVDTPLSPVDADFLDGATEEQPPLPRAWRKSKRRPSALARAPKSNAAAKSNESDGFDEPSGYFVKYDELDDLKSDEIPPQAGKWTDGESLRSPQENHRLRLLKKAASERLRRARIKKAAQAYTELRF